VAEPQNDKPPIEPLKSYIEGLGIPGLIVLMAVGAAAILAVLSGNAGDIFDWMYWGALLGGFAAVFGVFDMLGVLLGGADRFMNAVYQLLGYLTVWALVIAAMIVYSG